MMIPSYPSTRHWPASLTVHRDDHYHQDPSRFLDREVVITEKMDGGVTGIAGGSVYARSSAQPTHGPWFSYVKSVTLPKLYEMPKNLVCWGEDLFAVHSLTYDLLPDSFFLFHVLDRAEANIGTEHTEGDHFWAWDNVIVLADHYGLHHVPHLFQGRFKTVDEITAWFMDNIKKPSLYGPECEGFVMRVAEGFAFADFAANTAKFVRPNHVQTDARWEQNWKPARICPK